MPPRPRASWIDRVWRDVLGPRGHTALLRLAALLIVCVATASAAETLPPPPPNHFNDYAGMVRRETATQLNQELAQFERDTSNQLLVAIYQEMPSRSSVEDYTVRVAQSWRVGQKAKNNGAVLFVFQASRDLRIQVGYGLEGALPDALCKQIIEDEIVPRFRAGDFDAGLTAGVRSLIAATRGEYRGSGRLAADSSSSGNGGKSGLIFTIILVVIVLSSLRSASRRGTVYGRRGRRTVWVDRGGWGGWGGGGGTWGGGSGGGGGGSFSGGGGSFGGGGAGGKW